MSDIIVTLAVNAVFPNGREVALTARIGRAQPEAKDYVAGLGAGPHDAEGG